LPSILTHLGKYQIRPCGNIHKFAPVFHREQFTSLTFAHTGRICRKRLTNG